MTGVDILAMEEVPVEWAYNWMVFAILFCAGILATVICVIRLYKSVINDGASIALFVALGIVCSLLLSAGLGGVGQTASKYESQYKVTISDEVPMTEFLEKYEIIETEGKIYTVREKNNVE